MPHWIKIIEYNYKIIEYNIAENSRTKKETAFKAYPTKEDLNSISMKEC